MRQTFFELMLDVVLEEKDMHFGKPVYRPEMETTKSAEGLFRQKGHEKPRDYFGVRERTAQAHGISVNYKLAILGNRAVLDHVDIQDLELLIDGAIQVKSLAETVNVYARKGNKDHLVCMIQARPDGDCHARGPQEYQNYKGPYDVDQLSDIVRQTLEEHLPKKKKPAAK